MTPRTTVGCGADPPTVTAGSGVSAVAVDRTNNTVYVADGDGTVSVIDGARCDSLIVSGCHDTPHAVRTGAGTAAVVVDAKDHTVFALNGSDDTLSSIDAATCDGATPSACPPLAPAQRDAPELGPGASENDLIVTPGNDTAYVVNEGGAERAHRDRGRRLHGAQPLGLSRASAERARGRTSRYGRPGDRHLVRHRRQPPPGRRHRRSPL